MHQNNVIFFIIKYEPHLYNGCHDLMQKVMNFNVVAIVSVKRSDYRILFLYMSKNDAINIMKNSDLNEKSVSLSFFFFFFFVIYENE